MTSGVDKRENIYRYKRDGGGREKECRRDKRRRRDGGVVNEGGRGRRESDPHLLFVSLLGHQRELHSQLTFFMDYKFTRKKNNRENKLKADKILYFCSTIHHHTKWSLFDLWTLQVHGYSCIDDGDLGGVCAACLNLISHHLLIS